MVSHRTCCFYNKLFVGFLRYALMTRAMTIPTHKAPHFTFEKHSHFAYISHSKCMTNTYTVGNNRDLYPSKHLRRQVGMEGDRAPLRQIGKMTTRYSKNGEKQRRENRGSSDTIEQPYMKEYIKVLLKCEKTYLESPKNFRTNIKSRNVVVDWLIHVHDRYKLAQTVLHKTISLMDDYSSKKHVRSNTLQLVGIACMSLTTKNAGTQIDSGTLVEICGSYFGKDDLHDMEIDVLQLAQFDLNRPVCPQFLLVVNEYFDFPTRIMSVSKYFLDLWLFHHDFVRYRTSVVASTAILFALHAMDESPEILKWSALLAGLFKFTKLEMDKTLTALYKTVNHFDFSKHPSIQDKYSAENFKNACIKFRGSRELDGFSDLKIPETT